MKKISLLSFIIISVLCLATGCYNNTTLNTQGAINLLQNDMANIASTIRNLDCLYLEDYAINELNPMMNYNSYNNMDYSRNFNSNIVASVSAIPYSGVYNLNYSYEPKYIDNVNSLDTSYLVAYLQSMQDLFLITSDITAANQILNQLTFDIINDTINVRNNAYLLNYNINELTAEQIETLQEYSATINNILVNIENTNGYITNELNNLYELRNNFYKNTETLNAKYINVLNILENRIVQLQNIQLILERLNNQLLLMSDVNNFNNSNNNLINNGNSSEDLNNNNFEDNENIIEEDISNDEFATDCHDCQICDLCGNCADCDECEVCPNCQNQSVCDGNCNTPIDTPINNNSDSGIMEDNPNQDLITQELPNNNQSNNPIYGVLDNYNTQYNNPTNRFCHNCGLCESCGNCANCDTCQICPKCDLPSTCQGNCEMLNSTLENGNNMYEVNSPQEYPIQSTPTPNNGNGNSDNNPTGYSNYKSSTTAILDNDSEINYQSYNIYNNTP